MQCFTNYYNNIDLDTDSETKLKKNTKNDQINLDPKRSVTYQYKFGGSSNSKTITICRTLCFIAGALVEAYTYKLDPKNSHGLGWGIFAALALF